MLLRETCLSRKAETYVIEKVENRFWELDGLREEEVAPVIIDIGADSDNDDGEIDVAEMGPGGNAGPADAPADNYDDVDDDDDLMTMQKKKMMMMMTTTAMMMMKLKLMGTKVMERQFVFSSPEPKAHR